MARNYQKLTKEKFNCFQTTLEMEKANKKKTKKMKLRHFSFHHFFLSKRGSIFLIQTTLTNRNPSTPPDKIPIRTYFDWLTILSFFFFFLF